MSKRTIIPMIVFIILAVILDVLIYAVIINFSYVIRTPLTFWLFFVSVFTIFVHSIILKHFIDRAPYYKNEKLKVEKDIIVVNKFVGYILVVSFSIMIINISILLSLLFNARIISFIPVLILLSILFIRLPIFVGMKEIVRGCDLIEDNK